MSHLPIADYLRVIGRGKDGARALSREQACDLMTRLLGGQLSDLQKGGFALAMRIKGESPGELAGFMDAVRANESPFATECGAACATAGNGPVVVLPTYNGARKLPNLTPLLAFLLARENVPVLVHGITEDPARTTSAAIFDALDVPEVKNATRVVDRWANRLPAFVSLQTLNPALAGLLNLRRELGVRNPGHTMAKLIAPWPGVLRVINHTHPEYSGSLSAFLELTQATALLLRGTEGEPVADARRLPALKCFVNGQADDALSVEQQTGSLKRLPELPAEIDATTTASLIRSMLAGELPVPDPIAEQVKCLVDLRQASS